MEEGIVISEQHKFKRRTTIGNLNCISNTRQEAVEEDRGEYRDKGDVGSRAGNRGYTRGKGVLVMAGGAMAVGMEQASGLTRQCSCSCPTDACQKGDNCPGDVANT